MAVLIGIDEAGYGPLLGPLVISMAAFEIPDSSLKADHWELFKNAVSKNRKNLNGRILISDSKKAYNSKIGIEHLQKTILTVLFLREKKPSTVYQLLEILCPDCLKRILEYQWYRDIRNCNLNHNPDSIGISASVLGNSFKQCSSSLLDVKSVCLDVAYYNNLIEKIKNKAAVSFTPISQFIASSFKKYSDKNLQIVIDRQGGRTNYTKQLMMMFPDCQVEIIREDRKISSYLLSNGNKKMKIHFVVKADDNNLPVALASMASKYIRELMMAQINRYFINLNKNLKPTAGYWTDGKRFINDLKLHCPDAVYKDEHFIRNK